MRSMVEGPLEPKKPLHRPADGPPPLQMQGRILDGLASAHRSAERRDRRRRVRLARRRRASRRAVRLSAPPRRRQPDPRPAPRRMVRPRAVGRGRPQPRQYGPRLDRPGDPFPEPCRRGRGQGPRRRLARLPPRRARFPQLLAGRAAQWRFRPDDGAAIPVLDLAGDAVRPPRPPRRTRRSPRSRPRRSRKSRYHAELAPNG